MWHDADSVDPVFTDTLELDMGTVQASLAGPKRPQDRVSLNKVDEVFNGDLFKVYHKEQPVRAAVEGRADDIGDGDVVIAAITSCTNTSNPSVLVAAGLVARKARAKGLTSKPWVKTSLAPGSQVVTDYLDKAGLTEDLNALGFNLVGYGCTTCIGNSGPLATELSTAINENDIVAASVLSGNRNFEGRVSPDVRANFLASPPLVVAYAIKGTVTAGHGRDAAGQGLGRRGRVPQGHLADECRDRRGDGRQHRRHDVPLALRQCLCRRREMARHRGRGLRHLYLARRLDLCRQPALFRGHDHDPGAGAPISSRRARSRSSAIRSPPTTSAPAGSIKADSPAGTYLQEHQVSRADFNSYGARRGNHDVMMRGTFANIRIRNEMVPGIEGGMSKYEGEVMPIYDAAMRFKADGTPLVVIAGKEYGTGSSRDWAAKGTNLLGVRAVITESFERIHRSNLVGMGVLPLQFAEGVTRQTLGLDGSESFTIQHVADIRPRQDVEVILTRADGSTETFLTRCRIDTINELEYFLNGGILQYVLRKLAA